MEPRDEYFSRAERFSLGVDERSGRRYVAILVSIGVADYNEYYAVTDARYAHFLDDPSSAIPFVEECRRREHDDLLLQEPGWNRGTPV
ncbi:hypothetical protein [Orlajensenia leifsoniae]|uniref:Uncharacterized protein n=1 Tax=Orlajensenia leifsoniae TaxID=2561933 RepID=A0A4Y9QZN6_9MICO|nr:hypothetical protein [Leifsonia flava]TFV96636.1 hypothetical protein E4M00_11145 [Leifsonia flava]